MKGRFCSFPTHDFCMTDSISFTTNSRYRPSFDLCFVALFKLPYSEKLGSSRCLNATVNVGKVNLARKIKLKDEVDFVEEQNYITQGVLALIPITIILYNVARRCCCAAKNLHAGPPTEIVTHGPSSAEIARALYSLQPPR